MGLGAQDTVIAGGRYDLLMGELGGGAIPCLGWEMGVEGMLLGFPMDLPKIEHKKSIFIAVMGERFMEEGLKIRDMLQKDNFVCVMGNPEEPLFL